MDEALVSKIARAMCAEKCAQVGDPPCITIDPEGAVCDECEGCAKAAGRVVGEEMAKIAEEMALTIGALPSSSIHSTCSYIAADIRKATGATHG